MFIKYKIFSFNIETIYFRNNNIKTKEASRLYAELWLWVLWYCLFGSIVFSVNNVLTLSGFGCSIFVINLSELSQPFSSDLFQYCS